MNKKDSVKEIFTDRVGGGRHGPVWQVLDGERVGPPPVWLMRQAGRYLPEYREVRARAGSFLDLCYNPQLATEVTMQPIRRFDLDAAILFSDILVVPDALGQKVDFVQGEGPKLDPIDGKGIDSLRIEGALDRLAPVFETVGMIRTALDPDKTLIGFCGAPWTVATYMIAGHGTPDQAPARLFAAREPERFRQLIDILTRLSADYLIAQLRSGADCVQVFDSWSGVLGEEDFEAWCIEPMARIVSAVKQAVPNARIIGFPKGAGLFLKHYAVVTGVDGIGIDWTVPGTYAAAELQPMVAVQGNLDPLTLIAGGEPLQRAVRAILSRLGKGRLIFNLGHGIRPETPPEHVGELVRLVRDWVGNGR